MGGMQGYKIGKGMREQINVSSRGYGSVGRTWRGITSNVSKKTVLLEYLVDINYSALVRRNQIGAGRHAVHKGGSEHVGSEKRNESMCAV